MAPRNILLTNGVALVHDANNHVVPTKTDILIKDGKIAKLTEGIERSSDVEVIDCTDKIVSPGFVDTHHHGWQTQLKGRHANELLLEYMITGNSQHKQYTPKDVYYGQLAGMLEGIASGTTTVVDHAHITKSPDHVKLAISATASSGIRSVYGYTPMLIVKSFNPFDFHPNPLEDWVMQTFSELCDAGPFGDGRVTMGFAWDLWFLPKEVRDGIFDVVNKKGIRTVTSHSPTLLSITKMVHQVGLLDERMILSHGGTITKEDAELIRKTGAHVSATPSTEMQMAMGRAVCFDAGFPGDDSHGERVGVQANSSFGVDCHSNNAGSIISEARLGLQDARNHFNEYRMKGGKIPRKLPESLSVEAAFNLATINGAKGVRMEKEIGRIAEGYKADLAIFDALSPGMVGAAQHDPVAAIILHSSPADIDTVIVDGIVRKKDGKLSPVSVEQAAKGIGASGTLEWIDIAKEVVKSREVMQKEIEKVDVAEGMSSLMKKWHIDEALLVDD